MKLALFVILTAAIFSTACATADYSSYKAPLTDYLYIDQPDSSVPAERAAFSGKWHGAWRDPYNSNIDHILVVEGIHGNNVRVVYSIGRAASWQWQIEPRWDRWEGRFAANGELVLSTFPNGAVVSYRLEKNGTLTGRYSLDGNITTGWATMERMK